MSGNVLNMQVIMLIFRYPGIFLKMCSKFSHATATVFRILQNIYDGNALQKIINMSLCNTLKDVMKVSCNIS